MNTVSIVGSASRSAGGLFESVRRLHRELLAQNTRKVSQSAVRSVMRDEKVQSFSDTEITVQVLSLRDEFTEADLSAWEPVSVCPFGCYGPRAFGFAPDLLRKLFALKPDLAHVHGLWQFTSVVARSWHRKTHKPYMISPHGMLDAWALRNSRWKKALAWLAYEGSNLKSAACIRALCPAEARAIRALGLTNPICIIPNGVDLPKSGKREAEKRECGKQADNSRCIAESFDRCLGKRKLLLYLGRIHPKKGLCNLLKAWAEAQSPNEWVLAIAGWDQGGHEDELKRLADELMIRWSDVRGAPNLDVSLLFPGPQFGASKDYWLRQCDAFILPSLSEGIPMAVLEAWAYAKPVVMTPQCNLAEGFAAESALCIYPEPGPIAAGLRELFRLNTSTRERMGSRGLALVSSRFAWPQVAAELRSVYHWMTGAGPKPDCVLTH